LVITIDGPAASGKSTVAKLVAAKLGASFLDTGAMYRAVTLAAMRADVDMSNEEKLLAVLKKHRFDFTAEQDMMAVGIDGVDVTEQIREPTVTANSRYIASSVKVREQLVQMQRDFAARAKKVVTEGRDQGTVAFADADAKFYLIADPAERARRRHAELAAKGRCDGIDEIRLAIESRDESDTSRDVGPLKPADGAIIIDTTNLSVEQVVETIFGYVKERCPGKK
jgi:cytidylate kinase